MEEYEPHVVRGNVIYAGVDYEAILRAAEKDPDGCDVILWDGGNNDFPFYKPDLNMTVVDPHRPGARISPIIRVKLHSDLLMWLLSIKWTALLPKEFKP